MTWSSARKGGQAKFNAPIAKVKLSDPLLRGDEVVQAVHENLEILQLRAEHLFRKKGGGMVEHLAEKCQDKPFRDPVAKPARRYRATVIRRSTHRSR